MRLELESFTQGDVRVLRCRGRIIYGAEADALRERVNALLQETPRLVFHLGEVRDMDSGGIGRVVGMVVSARRAGGDIKFCHLSAQVDHVLHITGLLTIFEVFDTEEEAVRAFAAGVKASA
ncbi:MAG: STAS domain-containing protein [Acidobacteriota bacterium]|nr:STAS domain-containing protein [Acidobacteriota bacterium]